MLYSQVVFKKTRLTYKRRQVGVGRNGLDNSDEPADISISVSPETTFEGLKRKISQTTRISPSNQLLILKGKEWSMEEQEKICQCWTTDDLVAIFERKDFSSSESVEPSKFECIK